MNHKDDDIVQYIKVYFRLYIEAESVNRFFRLIKQFIQPEFQYKIGICLASSRGKTEGASVIRNHWA